MIGVLPTERWSEVEGVFKSDWNCTLPTYGGASIIANIDDDSGKINSFIVVEQLLRIGQIHSENHYPRPLFRWIENNMPKNNSVIVIAHEPRDVRICEMLDMYQMNEGIVYRKDY